MRPFSHSEPAILADGTLITVRVYEVDVFWKGAWTTALAEVLDGPLLGVRLCRDHRLTVEFRSGADVRLDPL